MKNVVDIAVSAMTKLGGNERPQMFQRGTSLYLVTPKGYAQLTYAPQAHLHSQGFPSPEISREYEELKRRAKSALLKDQPKDREKPNEFLSGEAPYFDAMAFRMERGGFCGSVSCFTIDDLAKAANDLKRLPQDGNIRVTNYVSREHDDGRTGRVFTDSAWVMPQEAYLEMMREREKRMIAELRRVKDPYHGQPFSRVPSCMILTENLMAGFPRGVFLTCFDNRKTGKETWTRESSPDSITPYFEEVYMTESPYKLTVATNGFRGIQRGRFGLIDRDILRKLGEVEKELELLEPEFRDIEKVVEGLNLVHTATMARHNLREARKRDKTATA